MFNAQSNFLTFEHFCDVADFVKIGKQPFIYKSAQTRESLSEENGDDSDTSEKSWSVCEEVYSDQKLPESFIKNKINIF